MQLIDDGVKEEYARLLIEYSLNGEMTYSYAIFIGKKFLGLDTKIIRKMLIELHYENFWKWENNKIKIVKPTEKLIY